MKKVVLFLILVAGVKGTGPTAAAVIDSLTGRLDRIRDYSVRVQITVDMPRFRMPGKTVEIYFKQPDKIKIESDGFAVVPRQGIHTRALVDSLTGIELQGSGSWAGVPCWILTGYRSEHGQRLQTRLWVDAGDWVVRRITSSLDSLEVLDMEVEYTLVDGRYLMPGKTTVRLKNVPGLTRREWGRSRQDPDADRSYVDEAVRDGSIILEFSRYRVNRGLKDRLFRESDL